MGTTRTPVMFATFVAGVFSTGSVFAQVRDVEANAARLGALDDIPLSGMDDGRNHPAGVILMARQWLRAGTVLIPRVRLQPEQSASRGEDDLTRPQVGGMNPTPPQS